MKTYLLLAIVLLSIKIKAVDFKNPGEIIFDSLNNRYLVQNYADGSEGFIMQIDKNGAKEYFVRNLTKPVGIEIVDTILYMVENWNFVKGFSLKTGNKVFQLEIPGVGQFCGLTSDKKKYLYATDIVTNTLYRINYKTSAYSVYFNNISKPSDIEFLRDSNQLILVTYDNPAKVHLVSIKDSTSKVLFNIPYSYSTCDGIEIDSLGNIFVSSWNNSSIVYFNKKDEYLPHVVAPGIETPIYMLVNKRTKILYTPSWNQNAIYEEKLNFYNVLESDSIFNKSIQNKDSIKISKLYSNSTLVMESPQYIADTNKISDKWRLFFNKFDNVRYTNKIYSTDLSRLKVNPTFLSSNCQPDLWDYNLDSKNGNTIYEYGTLECTSGTKKENYSIVMLWEDQNDGTWKIVKESIGEEKKINSIRSKTSEENINAYFIDKNTIVVKMIDCIKINLFDINGRQINYDFQRAENEVKLQINNNSKVFIIQAITKFGQKSRVLIRP